MDYSDLRTEKRIQKIKNVISMKQPDLTVILENINDPHNLSACVRSCDAVGVKDINLVYHSGQSFPKLQKKSSASARKWIDGIKYRSVAECFEKLRQEGKMIYTTHMAKDALSLYELDLTTPCALMFGNEHTGVSDEAVEMADANFLIPQVGMIQSLNISVACAVSLYEAFRQRLRAGMYAGDNLEDEYIEKLMEDWIRR